MQQKPKLNQEITNKNIIELQSAIIFFIQGLSF